MKNVMAVFLVATLVGCSTLPSQYVNASGKSLVVSRNSKGIKTLIRSIDHGDPIFIKGDRLGNKVWLSPGPHAISIICFDGERRDKNPECVTFELNVLANHCHEINVEFDGNKPMVKVKEVDLSYMRQNHQKDATDRLPIPPPVFHPMF